jgi:hypothetical protein
VRYTLGARYLLKNAVINFLCCMFLAQITVTLKRRLHGFLELHKCGIKSGKHCSYGRLPGTIQKVHKIAENMKWGYIKLEFTVGTSVTLISASSFPFKS